MSWKYFKKQFENGGADENKFILGLDLGSSSSSIAFFNTVTEEPELIDLSGGYGKPSMPSVIQYIPETREWVFGEYAILNKGLFDDCTIINLMNRLGKNDYLEIGSRTVSVVWLLAKYIKELIESCKNINPMAEIAGIVCTVPTYASEASKEELRAAFRGAGLEKQLIALIPARESILLHNHFSMGKREAIVCVIDYGARKIRGSIERLMEDIKGTYVVTESYFEDDQLGFDQIDEEIKDLFTDIYCAEKKMKKSNLTEQEKNQLGIFTHQNKAQMFKINANGRPSKLYYNFAFPPFVKDLQNETKLDFIAKLKVKISDFIDAMFAHSKTRLAPKDISQVICLGGGFESPFAKDIIEFCFPESEVTVGKYAKALLAEGAAIYAAKMLGIYQGEDYFIKDSALLASDIGVRIQQGGQGRFFPIAERNSFWWKERQGIVFTLTKGTDTATELTLYMRGKSGEEQVLTAIGLEGLEKRPKGATRLKMTMNFRTYREIQLLIEDFGFGELFPKTGFKKELLLDLADFRI